MGGEELCGEWRKGHGLRTGVARYGERCFVVEVAVQERGHVRGADLEGRTGAAEVVVEFGRDGSVRGWDVAFQDA